VKVPTSVLLIALSVALLGVAHWMPHLRALIGKPIEHPTRLKTNYTIGILCIFVPFTAWLIENDLVWVAQMMWIFITAGGLAVLAMYGLDDLVNWLNKIRNEREINDLRKRQEDAEQKRQ